MGSLTRWVFSSSSTQCIVSHDGTHPNCDPFIIAMATGSSSPTVSSSAQITATDSLDGTVVECRAGGLISSPLVGSVTINIAGNLDDFTHSFYEPLKNYLI